MAYRKVVPLDPGQVYHTDLTEAQWARLEPLLPQPERWGHKQEIPLRAIVNACLYVLRTGCQWRLLPREYPKWQAVYHHFAKWRREHVWQDVLDALREQERLAAGREPAPSLLIVDSQSVRTTEMGGQVGYDGGKKAEGSQAASGGGQQRDGGGGGDSD